MSHVSHAPQSQAVPKKDPNLKTFGAYLTGLIFCIILTVAAFGLVEKRLLTDTYLYIAISALAVVQLIVQSICFLRLNASPEGRWNLMPFLFAIFIVGVLVSGSLWIMYNMNYNMMN